MIAMITNLYKINPTKTNGIWWWDSLDLVQQDVDLPASGAPSKVVMQVARDLGIVADKDKGQILIDDTGYEYVLLRRNSEPLYSFQYRTYPCQLN